jgi:hypothetical protein
MFKLGVGVHTSHPGTQEARMTMSFGPAWATQQDPVFKTKTHTHTHTQVYVYVIYM